MRRANKCNMPWIHEQVQCAASTTADQRLHTQAIYIFDRRSIDGGGGGGEAIRSSLRPFCRAVRSTTMITPIDACLQAGMDESGDFPVKVKDLHEYLHFNC